MDEETPSDTKSEGSAMTDNTLGSVASSSQEVGLLEGPLELSHLAGGDGGAEQASVCCGGPNTPMVGGMLPTQHIRSEEKTKSQNPLPLHCLLQTVPNGRTSFLQRCLRMPPLSSTGVTRMRLSAMLQRLN